MPIRSTDTAAVSNISDYTPVRAPIQGIMGVLGNLQQNYDLTKKLTEEDALAVDYLQTDREAYHAMAQERMSDVEQLAETYRNQGVQAGKKFQRQLASKVRKDMLFGDYAHLKTRKAQFDALQKHYDELTKDAPAHHKLYVQTALAMAAKNSPFKEVDPETGAVSYGSIKDPGVPAWTDIQKELDEMGKGFLQTEYGIVYDSPRGEWVYENTRKGVDKGRVLTYLKSFFDQPRYREQLGVDAWYMNQQLGGDDEKIQSMYVKEVVDSLEEATKTLEAQYEAVKNASPRERKALQKEMIEKLGADVDITGELDEKTIAFFENKKKEYGQQAAQQISSYDKNSYLQAKAAERYAVPFVQKYSGMSDVTTKDANPYYLLWQRHQYDKNLATLYKPMQNYLVSPGPTVQVKAEDLIKSMHDVDKQIADNKNTLNEVIINTAWGDALGIKKTNIGIVGDGYTAMNKFHEAYLRSLKKDGTVDKSILRAALANTTMDSGPFDLSGIGINRRQFSDKQIESIMTLLDNDKAMQDLEDLGNMYSQMANMYAAQAVYRKSIRSQALDMLRDNPGAVSDILYKNLALKGSTSKVLTGAALAEMIRDPDTNEFGYKTNEEVLIAYANGELSGKVVQVTNSGMFSGLNSSATNAEQYLDDVLLPEIEEYMIENKRGDYMASSLKISSTDSQLHNILMSITQDGHKTREGVRGISPEKQANRGMFGPYSKANPFKSDNELLPGWKHVNTDLIIDPTTNEPVLGLTYEQEEGGNTQTVLVQLADSDIQIVDQIALDILQQAFGSNPDSEKKNLMLSDQNVQAALLTRFALHNSDGFKTVPRGLAEALVPGDNTVVQVYDKEMPISSTINMPTSIFVSGSSAGAAIYTVQYGQGDGTVAKRYRDLQTAIINLQNDIEEMRAISTSSN